jgi:hypothetical protein
LLRPLAISTAALLALLSGAPAGAAGGSSCGVLTVNAQGGVGYRVLFAKNGAVQRYVLFRTSHNTEDDDAALRHLVTAYGPEAVNAPPLRILSFRPSPGGGFQVPDKAVDSCGRVSHFR